MLSRAPLGGTGMSLTRVGFGAWATGGGGWRFGWGSQDDDDSVAAIRHAVESGVNWIDTAPVYGLGRSEQVVGRALRDLPAADRPYVFTKCGLRFDEHDPTTPPRNVLAPASVRWELERSLQRLGVDRIDLYQVHWPPQDGTPLEEYWQCLVELRDEGKVRAIGISNHDAAQLAAAEAIGHVDAIQPPLSLIHREAAEDLLPWAAQHGSGVIAYSPLQAGLLSGAMTAERVSTLPPDDWRAEHPDFQGADLARNLALSDALRPIARRHDVPVAAVAVAWVLAWPAVTGAIVGARTPQQVGGWLPAGSLELDAADLGVIAEAIRSTGAGAGPIVPARGTPAHGTPAHGTPAHGAPARR
jgi:aryl-alcohol dehydrogenase-like predicted oxidoreductase